MGHGKKIPVAYFLLNGLTGEQKKGLVCQCLLKTHEAGINVVNVTFDIPPANLTMAKHLGCNLDHHKLQISFKHPATNEDIMLYLDPCHTVKLVRNTLGEKGSLVDNEGKFIE